MQVIVSESFEALRNRTYDVIVCTNLMTLIYKALLPSSIIIMFWENSSGEIGKDVSR